VRKRETPHHRKLKTKHLYMSLRCQAHRLTRPRPPQGVVHSRKFRSKPHLSLDSFPFSEYTRKCYWSLRHFRPPPNQPSQIYQGHGNEAEFLGFLHKSLSHESLTLPFFSSRSDFGFEFVEIFVIEKNDSPSRGVDDSPTHR
jgi:hypothetical protein